MFASHSGLVRLTVAAGVVVIGLILGSLRAEDATTAGTSADKPKNDFKHGVWPINSPTKPDVPKAKEKTWIKNPIDAFVLAKLEEKGLRPNASADKLTLLRRVTFDLTGLPPTRAEQEAYLADDAPDAYEKLVERLLASPRYGERWAQHWLDIVRYAESDGFKQDAHRPFAYGYRDYVIRALNADLPYDRFIKQQLAGDELEPDNPDALAATGYCRLHPDEYNAANLKQRRQEILDDVTDTTGLAFLGLTMGCAQCHDHKFDAILQADYYRLQAFLANIIPRDDAMYATPEQAKEFEEKQTAWEDATKDIRAEMDEILNEKPFKPDPSKYDEETKAAILTPADKRDTLQKQLVQLSSKNIELTPKNPPADKKTRFEELKKKLAEFDHLKPQPLPGIMGIADAGPIAPVTYRLGGGNFKNPKEEVEPGFPGFLGHIAPEIKPPAAAPNSTGRRAALAEWLARGDHPLTARVMVNRLWQHHFGVGIVASTNDFGVMGESATHPELLDWLAVTFVGKGWSLKAMHRLMLLSATYQQSSRVNPADESHAAAIKADPQNKLLWHMRRQRLEGEAIRDSVLAVTGDLTDKMFGPSAKPELPAALDSNYAWKADAKAEDRNRRSIYVLVQRNMRFPMFDAFDWPDLHNSCARRSCTTTAPQSLLMLNGEFTLQEARRWAEQLLRDHPSERKNLIAAAYQTAWSRTPTENEITVGMKFLQTQAELAKQQPGKMKDAAKEIPKDVAPADFAALVDFCHALMNANEFLFVD